MSVLERPSGRARWPLVSVLIPAFNHARFVQRCLDSVLEDPYPSKEIVIINDGSSDDTGEQIAAWIALHGHRVPVQFVQRSNRGVAATLNELALRARGSICGFVRVTTIFFLADCTFRLTTWYAIGIKRRSSAMRS